MWSAYVVLTWISALIFTILYFKWPRQFFLGILSGVFWIAMAYSTVQVDFIFAGSVNPILYNHELGDWYGETELMYLLGSVGVLMFIFTFGNLLTAAKDDVVDHWEGKIQPLETLRRAR